MGDINQHIFIERRADRLFGPYLEAGSKDYGTTQDLRPLFARRGEYLGVDREAGRGVDLVLDLAADFQTVDAALNGRRFGTIFCLSVLEHVERPFRMADNLTRLLAPGGCLCVAAPFAFKFHGYPSDYWRFTHEGIKKLFGELDFPAEDCAAATSRVGEFHAMDDRIGRIDFRAKPHFRRGRILRGIAAEALGRAARVGLFRWLAGYRYVLAPTMILMIGVRKEGSAENGLTGC